MQSSLTTRPVRRATANEFATRSVLKAVNTYKEWMNQSPAVRR
jgi:hypothetical protein